MKQITKNNIKRVVNNVEKSINEKVGIFTGYKTMRMDTKDGMATRLIVWRDGCCGMTSVVLESLQEVVKRYEKRYEGVLYCLDVFPYKRNDDGTYYYAPSFEIVISVKG